jgi:N-acyl-L-homoserine lactone synthetase
LIQPGDTRRVGTITIRIHAGMTTFEPTDAEEQVGMTDFTGRLDVTFGPPDPALPQCEAEVLNRWYGDTAESLERDYADHADATMWLSVRDDAERVLGTARLFVPGPRLPKTLADVSGPPWNLDARVLAAQVGFDPHGCLDIATIAVRPGLGGDGGRVAAALYHGIVMSTRVNGIDWVVAVLHVLVRRVLGSAGLVMHPLPGATPGVYTGTPGFLPVYANMDRVLSDQRDINPEAHRQVVSGDIQGLDVPSATAFLLPLHQAVDLREAVEMVDEVDLGAAESRTA